MAPQTRQPHPARLTARILLVASVGLSMLAASAQASERTRTFEPVRKTDHLLIFEMRGINASKVTGARANLRSRSQAAKSVARQLSVSRVRAAVDRERRLRIRRPRAVAGGRLKVELTEAEPQPTTNSDCAVDPATLTAPACEVLSSDTADSADPESLWGNIECADDSRQGFVDSDGDPHPTVTGTPQADSAFRRISVLDGDDFYGERCELGRNEHRFPMSTEKGTFAVYREGERRVTMLSLRLPASFPIETSKWQTVVQMKQAQPSAAGGGGPVLELQIYDGRLNLINSWNEVWSTPVRADVWTRIAFDVTYSSDPGKGSIRMLTDTNGDGDALDPGEQSPEFRVATLKTEIAGGWDGDGVAPGEPIPSHLRTGIYHDEQIPCDPECSLDLDNVQVAG